MVTTKSPPELCSNKARQRVCKACDRCRRKKSKCDGFIPCARCKFDNAICTFNVLQKPKDTIYPPRYVEVLEQQQAWLVNGLQILYSRCFNGEQWPDAEALPSSDPLRPTKIAPPLQRDGKYSIHDLLVNLGIVNSAKGERFIQDSNAIMQDIFCGGNEHERSLDYISEMNQIPVAPSRLYNYNSSSHIFLYHVPSVDSQSNSTAFKEVDHQQQNMQLNSDLQQPSTINYGFLWLDEMTSTSVINHSNLNLGNETTPHALNEIPTSCFSNGGNIFDLYLNLDPTDTV